MPIKTPLFADVVVTEVAKLFTEENALYVFGSDYEHSTPLVNSLRSRRDFLERVIFGIRVAGSDIAYMITNRPWASDIVYEMYDDVNALEETPFYVVVEPAPDDVADYYVFKCLFNNNGGASTSKPIFDENVNEAGGQYVLGDGYIWKYICTIPHATAKKFKTRDKFPIIIDDEVANSATDGIDIIQVENFATNFGYSKISGKLSSVDIDGGMLELSPYVDYTFEENVNFYLGQSAYITKKSGDEVIGADQFEVLSSGKNASGNFFITVRGLGDSTIELEKEDEFVIFPTIKITGDGSGARALPLFNAAGTVITKVQMLDRGSGYTIAVAEVVPPLAFNEVVGATPAELRPIMSPPGGHGSDVIVELRASDISVATKITSNLTEVPDTGTYSKVGLVLNPIFESNTSPDSFDNRVKVTLSSASSLSVGSEVSQTDEEGRTVTGLVHEIDGSDVYLVNFNGPHNIVFDDSRPLNFESVDINIVAVQYPDFVQKSGRVLFMTEFTPIERTASDEELVNILMDF